MDNNHLGKVRYTLFLAAGLCCTVVIKALRFSGISGIALLVWLYVVLEAVSRFRKKSELILTGATFVIGYCVLFWKALGNVWISLTLFTVTGIGIYLTICASAAVMLRWNRFVTTLVFPAIWLLDYFLVILVRFPTFVRVDAVFTDMTALIYAERFLSSPGLCFILLWIVAILRYAVFNRKAWPALLGAGAFLLLMIPGIIERYPNIAVSETVRVAYTTGPYVGDFMDYTSLSYEEYEESMEKSIRNAAAEGAEILVFSEEAFELNDTDEGRFLDRCAQLAKENDLCVLVALDVNDTDGDQDGKGSNEIIFIDNYGEKVGSYRKSRLIPLVESEYLPGDGIIPSHRLNIHGKDIKISYLICYESNFTSYIGRIDDDTDILFLPSWDWASVTELHSKLCRTIAVENGISILKPTYDGLSIAVDPDGRVFHTSLTSETGYETIQLVEMPVKSSAHTVARDGYASWFIPAIIGTEAFSILICLTLFIGNLIENRAKTSRSHWFSILVFCAMTGCICDALSWALDGCERLNSVLLITTMISMFMTLVMCGNFISYLTEYVKEKRAVSPVPVMITWVIMVLSVALTIVGSLNGSLFTIENGVYSDGPFYALYVVTNSVIMLIGLVIITAYRKSLGALDKLATYAYVLIPLTSALINLFVEDFSFAYPAVAISLLLIYVMIQSDRVEMLENEGRIVSYHAAHDEMTGLHNRRAYLDHLKMIKGEDGQCGVIFGDLNGLKYANDHFGHEAGDALILRYSGILFEHFRMNEIYRISGDEFICLLEGITEEAFISRVAELKEILSQEEPPLACIGAAFGPDRDVELLVKEAEIMMYEEKDIVHERFPKTRR